MTRTTASLIAGALVTGGVVTTSYVVQPVELPCRVLSFFNTNNQPLEISAQTSTNLLNWRTETNTVVEARSWFEWKDYDINQPAKFYRVEVNWWY